MKENSSSVAIERISSKSERMKKLGIVEGSVEEFKELIAKKDCNGNVATLHFAFPGKRVFCHHQKYTVPLVMATVLTPFHTGRMKLDGHLVCQLDCGRGCQKAHLADDAITTIQPFRIGPDNSVPTKRELIGAGKFVPSSQGLCL